MKTYNIGIKQRPSFVTRGFFRAFCVLLSFLIFTAAMAETSKNVIKIAMIDYPPLMASNGGIMNDLAEAAFQSQGVKVDFQIQPMSRITYSLENGSIPAVLGTQSWSFKSKVVPVRLFFSGLYFFSLKEKFPNGVEFKTLEELSKYEIGYSRGGALIPIFNKAKLNPILVVKGDQNVKKLYFGRIDMFASTELAGWGIIEKHYPKNINEFTMSKKYIHQITGDIIFANHQQELIQTFRKGLKHIKGNGVFLKVLQKYYKDREIPHYLLDGLK
ncbi:MAG: transporter substrate-binding domain-containing protein [Bermanella sp.]